MNANTQTTPARFDPDKLRLLVRVGVFVLLVILGRWVFPVLMQPFGGSLVVSALSAFATGGSLVLLIVTLTVAVLVRPVGSLIV